MIDGSRKLPTHHLTIRVPWHDAAWNGTVCSAPGENTSCLVLSRIAERRDDVVESEVAGRALAELRPEELPICHRERGAFMAPFLLRVTARHPYTDRNPETHGHIVDTSLQMPPYSAACVPFRWMLLQKILGDDKTRQAGIAAELGLEFDQRREPELKFPTAWTQERTNQLVMLDTFFGAVAPQESLCFFYAKRTPLSESGRRVIVGVGRVLSVGNAVEYRYKTSEPPLRCVLWERNVGHSIREDFADGFLLPYQEILAEAGRDPSLRPEDYVAFAPDELFDRYSFASELLPHDGAISSLLACQAALVRIADKLPGPWDRCMAWIDRELNRLWTARGPFPGLGSALCAFGIQLGTLLAYEISEIQAKVEKEAAESPWAIFDALVRDRETSDSVAARTIGKSYRAAWLGLKPERRALLELLSRFAINADQATWLYQETERSKLGLTVTDSEILANPYLVYELGRRWSSPVALGTVDRGLLPHDAVRAAYPVPEPSAVLEAVDPRRVRAAVVDALEGAAGDGHTLLPRNHVIQSVREAPLSPPCPLSEDFLAVTEPFLAPVVRSASLARGAAGFQLDRFELARELVEREVRKRVAGRRHPAAYDWLAEVERVIAEDLPADAEDREVERAARAEKAAALAEIFESRFAVLVGPAGTGKTTLLRALCALPAVKDGGILLLAPTGKARVRLETQTGLRGAGKTVAQLLLSLDRYNPSTGCWSFGRDRPRCSEYRTVIVDESSMLTEEQLAALVDGLAGVERLILAGDPRQLPPIGAGRPFVDIVRALAPDDVETRIPRRGPGYAELTITRRQRGRDRDDLRLASWFSGAPLEPGADDVWTELAAGRSDFVALVEWTGSDDLQEKLTRKLVEELGLRGPDDEDGFELSLGGSPFEGAVYFWAEKAGRPGAASKADAWQILSPARGRAHGVDALNRAIQERFRRAWRAKAEQHGNRKVPRPAGPQGILYGDKVINIVNHRRSAWGGTATQEYLANGDIGVVVGQYKHKNFKSTPKNLDVEFATQPGLAFAFRPRELSEDAAGFLELAYALTVHKTQGSEFDKTFVILPNPCWLLSRELLYTALTRHTGRLVLFHQGPLRDFLPYADARRSDIARRVTNLLHEPELVALGEDRRLYEAGLIHRTERGDLVRSKSELVIANMLHGRKIEYVYERLLRLPDGSERYPDFTIDDAASGTTYYWEHLGMLDDPRYLARWKEKLARYRLNGILPAEEGGGPNGTLITTQDEPGGALDARTIATIIDGLIDV